MVDNFKYLRLDNKLSLSSIQRAFKKRAAIHKLKGLSAAPHPLLLLHQSTAQPIPLYCSTCFFSMLSATNWVKVTNITSTAAKIIGLPTPNLSELNCTAITRIASTTAQDITHPHNRHLAVLPSEVQEGSLWQKPGTCSRTSPERGDPLRELSLVFLLFCLSLCAVVCKMHIWFFLYNAVWQSCGTSWLSGFTGSDQWDVQHLCWLISSATWAAGVSQVPSLSIYLSMLLIDMHQIALLYWSFVK